MLQNVRGTRDIPPEEMIVRLKVLDIVRQMFEDFGFVPLETPALERWEVLGKKGAGGSEVLEECFRFKDKGGREVGLRYDLTVPLARFVASNPSLTLPFKRYQIDRVWRYGDVARGRLREFWQADIDIVGSKSIQADAEVVACAVLALRRLGFKKFFVRLNNRKILNELVKYAGVPCVKVVEIIRTIDKLDKIGEQGVKKELEKIVSKESTKKVMSFLKIRGKNALDKAREMIGDNDGIKELGELVEWLEAMGINEYRIDLSLARGLDYYTGPIFEIFAEEGIGSIGGGGRYDNLIKLFSGREVPATGISLGLERIIEVMREKNMIKGEKTKAKVFVAPATEDVRKEAMKIAFSLRESGIPCDTDLMDRKLGKQLEYASKMNVSFVIIVGPKDLAEGKITLRNMKSGKEKKVFLKELLKSLKSMIR